MSGAPRTVVTFRAAGRRYAVDVAAVAAVRETGDVRPLPEPLPEIAGVVEDAAGALPVLAPFGPPGAHVLVLAGSGGRFALAVDEVERVERVPEGGVGPAPAGQARPIVVGTVGDAMLLDPSLLAGGVRA